MASSLAQQLSQVRSHNAAQLGNAKSAAKVLSTSYLFPPQVASSQDLQTLQALGENGWEELSAYDNTFTKWDQVTGAGDLLFGESSRGLDRLMKTKEENQNLDRIISEFFALSGGNLLDRSTGKCIEWLVRRFRIHEYNVEVVLSAFMPYHETQEFARMLQLLNLQDKPQFAFLLPLQKRATPLPSSVLITTLLSPPSTTASLITLRWVINSLSPKSNTRFRRPNHPLQSFWLSTIIKFCASILNGGTRKERSKSITTQVDEHQLYLSILLPTSVDAAVTTQLGLECQIGGCLALCSIATSFNLSIDARRSICSGLVSTKMDAEKAREAYLTTLACLCKDIDDIDCIWSPVEKEKIVTSTAALQLSRKPSIFSSIKKLSQSYDMTIFLLHLVASLSNQTEDIDDDDQNRASKLIEELVNDEDILSDGILSSVIAQAKDTPIQGQEGSHLLDVLQRSRRHIFEYAKKDASTSSEKVVANGSNEIIVPVANGISHKQRLLEMASRVDVSSCHQISAIENSSEGASWIYQSAVKLSLTDDNDDTSSGILTSLFSGLGDASITFLASVWTTSSFTVEIRLTALRHAFAFLSAFTTMEPNVRLVDFQTLIPSLLLALRDREAMIRLEALLCIERIYIIGTAIESKISKEVSIEMYGFDTIYGTVQSEFLKYLDTADVVRLIKSLLQEKASFEHDALYINIWLKDNLNSNRGLGKKEATYRKRVIEVLSSHILCWTNSEAKVVLLDALAGVTDGIKLVTLLPMLQEAVDGILPSGLEKDQFEVYISLLFGIYDSSAKDAIDTNEGGCWTLLLKALEEGSSCIQKWAAICLKRTIFNLLSDSKKREVFARLANLVANSMTALPLELRSCLLDVKIDPSYVVPILHDFRGIITSHALKTTHNKKAKGAAAGLDDETWTRAMAVLVEILEALLSRRSLPSPDFIAELFDNIRLGTELLLSGHSSSEYFLQVSMSNLRASLEMLRSSSKQQVISPDIVSSLRVDTIVNVIKTPSKPQTFHQALLLLSVLSTITPEVVLHNVMPVFTFVGSTMLQRDDDYSFIVVERTLQSILPPVLKEMASKATGKGELALFQASRNLLCVFTDAAKHVPRHRRESFFSTLINVMGSNYLAAICMLLVDRNASKVSKQSNKEDVEATLQLPLSLFTKKNDNPGQLWKALNGIWNEVERLWNHRSEDAIEMQENVFLDCVGGLGSEHEGGRRAVPIKRISALIRFINLAVNANEDALEDYSLQIEENKDLHEEEKVMWDFINRSVIMSHVNNPAISTFAQASLEGVMRIVPAHILFSVTIKLLQSEEVQDKQNGLHLCTRSIFSMTEVSRVKSSASIVSVVKECYNLVQDKTELRGLALTTLLAIAEESIASEHAALSSGLPQLIKLARSDSGIQQEQVLLLLTALSRHLGPRLIPQLAEIMSLSLHILGSDVDSQDIKSLVLGLLNRLVRAIPLFVASHLNDIIRLFIRFPSLQQMKQSSALVSSIIRFTPSLQLLNIVFSVWEQGDKTSLSLHTTCLDLLERTIKISDKKSITSSHKIIFRQITTIFDVRRHSINDPAKWSLSPAELTTVESKTISAFLRLILKLNEGAFRPLFLRFCDWALLDLVNEDEEKGSNDNLEVIARKIVLFKFVNALLTELGELVINYYLNVLDGAIDALTSFQQGLSDSVELWYQVILSLQQSARVDKGRGSFWNESRVKAVIPILIAQISTPFVKDHSSHESLLGDAITAICQTVPDEPSIKLTNNLLLECTRSSQIRIKVSSIRILIKIWKSEECEDSLLRLVPETVPSIAELLQESEVVVQDEMAGFVSAVEKVLGEGLESYLQ